MLCATLHAVATPLRGSLTQALDLAMEKSRTAKLKTVVAAALALIVVFAFYASDKLLPKDVTYSFGDPRAEAAFVRHLEEQQIPYSFSKNVRSERTIVLEKLEKKQREDLDRFMLSAPSELDTKRSRLLQRSCKV